MSRFPNPDLFTMLSPTLIGTYDVIIDIGEIPILVRTDNADFANMLACRYGEFVASNAPAAAVELEIRLVEPGHGIRNSGHGNRDSGPGLSTPDPGLQTPESDEYDQDLSVRLESGRWVMERGDFRAEWDPETHQGWVRQTANPYSIDGVLRILHSLMLARTGGFLVHAASAVRTGRAFVFAGVSGTGKTTISRLAPPDVTLLTDEITYLRPEEQVTGYRLQVAGNGGQGSGVRRGEQVSGAGRQEPGVRGDRGGESQIADSKFKITNLGPQISNPQSQTLNPESRIPNSDTGIPNPESRIQNPESRVANSEPLSPVTFDLSPAFSAFGTPFAGELARIGQKVRAPLETLFLLKQGPENLIEPVSEGQAVRELMRHVLFFAHDEELVGMIFQTVCDFVRRVPVRRLVFTKDASVWELIG